MALWGIGLPAGLTLQSALPLPELPPEARRLYPDAQLLIDDARFAAQRRAYSPGEET